MNDILINAFVARIKAEDMTIEQVPIPYKEVVEEAIEARFEEMD